MVKTDLLRIIRPTHPNLVCAEVLEREIKGEGRKTKSKPQLFVTRTFSAVFSNFTVKLVSY